MPLKSFYKFALPEFAPSNGEPPCSNLSCIKCAALALLVCIQAVRLCAAGRVASPAGSTPQLTACASAASRSVEPDCTALTASQFTACASAESRSVEPDCTALTGPHLALLQAALACPCPLLHASSACLPTRLSRWGWIHQRCGWWSQCRCRQLSINCVWSPHLADQHMPAATSSCFFW